MNFLINNYGSFPVSQAISLYYTECCDSFRKGIES
jgi:hypothetical protein